MSPADVFSHTNPPDEITTRGNMLSWWQILLGVMALMLFIILLVKFAPWIIYGIGKAIAMPFKALMAICKSGKERRRERRKERKERRCERKAESKERRKVRRQERKERKEAEKPRQEMEQLDYEWEERLLDEIDWDSINWEDLDGMDW